MERWTQLIRPTTEPWQPTQLRAETERLAGSVDKLIEAREQADAGSKIELAVQTLQREVALRLELDEYYRSHLLPGWRKRLDSLADDFRQLQATFYQELREAGQKVPPVMDSLPDQLPTEMVGHSQFRDLFTEADTLRARLRDQSWGLQNQQALEQVRGRLGHLATAGAMARLPGDRVDVEVLPRPTSR